MASAITDLISFQEAPSLPEESHFTIDMSLRIFIDIKWLPVHLENDCESITYMYIKVIA